MSDEKPIKHVEPSPLDKFMEEIRTWRAGRSKRQSVKIREKAEHFNETRHLRRKRKTGAINVFSVIGWFFGILAELILGLFSLFFGLFRFAIWIGAIAGIIWILTTIEIEDKTVGAAKEQAIEAKEKISGEVGDVIQTLSDEINEIKKNWHIEIRSKGEDGETDVIEFGTKQDDPPEPPEKP